MDSSPIDIGGAQSVARAINLLKIVGAGSSAGATLAEIVKRTDLHRATAHRLLAALVREGLLEQDATHRYHAGIELWLLGDAAARRFDIRELGRATLAHIA